MFSFGTGLVTQLGPFTPTKNDYPRFNKKENRKFGRSGGTCHARTFTDISPPSFPMQFPMPATVLKHNDYQSIVTIHDVTKSLSLAGKPKNPPGRLQTPLQIVGLQTLGTSTQKAGLGAQQNHTNIQSQEIEILRDLAEDPQLKLQSLQEGTSTAEEVYHMPGDFPQTPPLPQEYGTGNVVVHTEEVSRQALGETGYIFVDADNYDNVEAFHHLQGNHATHEGQMVDAYNASRSRTRIDRQGQSDQYRTRQDVITSYSENPESFNEPESLTLYIDNGGGDLRSFTPGGGTLTTSGRYERFHHVPNNFVTPATGDLTEQALDMMEIRTPSPYEAQSLGPSEITKQRYTRPLSPIRQGRKRPKSPEPDKPNKKRVTKHEYNTSTLKRKAKELQVDQLDVAREHISGPQRRRRKIAEHRGKKRKNSLEHPSTKRTKL